MSKEEFIQMLNSMIDEEMSILNIQSEDFNPEVLHKLWRVKELAMQLE